MMRGCLVPLLVHCLASADAACPHASAALHANRGGCDHKQVATSTYAGCQAACCNDTTCAAWNWDSNLTAGQRRGGCVGNHEGCCWLKGCVATPTQQMCGGGGEPGCTSWTGTSGRPPSTPPPPPPPPPPKPVCPMGEGKPCFHNHGTPTYAGATASYDCEMRKHAYEFAQKTLPSRGDFKSAYDALQLAACGVPEPAKDDLFTPPNLAAPKGGKVLHLDAKAPSGGDGTAAKPFSSIDDAVKAAVSPGPKTILLSAGTYFTRGIVLTEAHSGLTIQNNAGAVAILTGAIPVANSLDKWSVVDKTTNTWKLDTTGQDLPTEFGLRVGSRRAIRAKFPNGDPETAASYCSLSHTFDAGTYVNGSGRSMNLPAYFARVAAPLNKPLRH